MNTQKLLIVGAAALVGYMLISKKAIAQPAGNGGRVTLPARQMGPGTPGYAANRQVMADRETNATLYQAGSALGGLFRGVFGGGGDATAGQGSGPTLRLQVEPYGTGYGANDWSVTGAPYVPAPNNAFGGGWGGIPTRENDWSLPGYIPDYSATNIPFQPTTDAQSLYSDFGYGE